MTVGYHEQRCVCGRALRAPSEGAMVILYTCECGACWGASNGGGLELRSRSSPRDVAHEAWRAAGEPTAAAALVIYNGLVLVERGPNGNRAPGIPGGKREPGEHPLDTAVRELLEETGVKASMGLLFLEEQCGDHLTNIYLVSPDRTPEITVPGATWNHPADLLVGSRFPETYARCFAHMVHHLGRLQHQMMSASRILGLRHRG